MYWLTKIWTLDLHHLTLHLRTAAKLIQYQVHASAKLVAMLRRMGLLKRKHFFQPTWLTRTSTMSQYSTVVFDFDLCVRQLSKSRIMRWCMSDAVHSCLLLERLSFYCHCIVWLGGRNVVFFFFIADWEAQSHQVSQSAECHSNHSVFAHMTVR